MEHRCHGHVHVTGIQVDLGFVYAETGHEPVGVKDELTVAVVNAFRHSRGACGVKRGGHGVFVKIREIITGAGMRTEGIHIRRKDPGLLQASSDPSAG